MLFTAPHGELIRIEFRDSFHLEDSPTCEYDYLEIRDGEYGYSKVLAKLCGHNFPSDIISSDRYLYIRYVSDDTIEYSGFRAVYHFIPQPSEFTLISIDLFQLILSSFFSFFISIKTRTR